MKKIILFLLFSFIFISCEKASFENSVPNPKDFTTLKIQELPKDTVVIAYDDITVYMFDTTNVVKYQAKIVNNNILSIHIGYVILLLLCLFLMGLGLGLFMSN